MEIQFLGATETVTGSKYLLKAEKNILVDCGLFQGLKELRLKNREKFPIDPATIEAVVLTHAHLDHTGYLPLLVKNGFKGKIYCTKPTKELCKILLKDSGFLQEEEAARANKYKYSKHSPAIPLYTAADAEAVFGHLVDVDFHQEFSIGDCTFYYSHAGHIHGSAFVLVKNKDTSILFTGDLGRSYSPFIHLPEEILPADYLVIESTYGNRLHGDINPKDELCEIINKTAARGGSVIIPAFAVGRTQSLLYYIYQLQQEGKIPNIPVFIDSPMAKEVAQILLTNLKGNCFSEEVCEASTKVARYVSSVEESKEIDTYSFPRVIISASGMLTGGRILHHLRALAGDDKNTIVFSGYQAKGTRGDALINGDKILKIYGEMVKVNAQIVTLHNMSAHVDYNEMLAWLKNLKTPPHKVFITHGELDAALFLQNKIKETFNWPCIIPGYLQTEKL